ncbi:MAG: flagellar basal body rod protein FlgB [candidate division Zixibacteria bacterium]|nr:flagellar basal body rod protein FlgB [candidate division Zixibacteria bacterium]
MDNKLTQFMFEGIGVSKYKKYMDLASLRHRLISSNVANAATPGYRSKDIDFQKEFARATEQSNHIAGSVTDNQHIALGQSKDRGPKINEEKVNSDNLNSVDIDEEVTDMAQNELLYTIGARLLQKKFDGLRKAITSK